MPAVLTTKPGTIVKLGAVQRPRQIVTAMEISGAEAEERIDAENHVIRGVKIIGLRSQNPASVFGLSRREFGEALDKPYRYSLEALKDAARLYEGVRVYLDHPHYTVDRSGARHIESAEREVEDHFGRIVNVQVREDGLYGDLEYLASHTHAAKVIETAQRMPEQLALSHNALTEPQLVNGEVVIVRISHVRSVDLISERPGTTTNLFESSLADDHQEQTVSKKLKQIVESAPAGTKCRARLRYALEMMDEDEHEELLEMDVDVPAEATPEEQVEGAFRSLILAVLDDESLDTAAKLDKIKTLLTKKDETQAAVTPETPAEGESMEQAEEEEMPEGGNGEGEANGDEEKKTAAESSILSLQRKIKQLEAQDRARETLESAGVTVTGTRIRVLAGIKNSEDTQAMLAEWKKAEKVALETAAPRPPRSASPYARKSQQETPHVPNGKAFAAGLR